MNPEMVAENAASLAELHSLIESLQDADYARPVGASRWTVATALCHLAYWDHVAVKYLDQWKRTGKAVRFEADAIHTVNQAGLEVFGAVPGPAAAELALRSAERIDNEVQHTDSLLAEQMIAAGREHIVRRALHRRNHMEQIKQALGEW